MLFRFLACSAYYTKTLRTDTPEAIAKPGRAGWGQPALPNSRGFAIASFFNVLHRIGEAIVAPREFEAIGDCAVKRWQGRPLHLGAFPKMGPFG